MSLFGHIGVLCVCLISGQASANEEVAGNAVFCKTKNAKGERDYVGIEFTNKKLNDSSEYMANIFNLFTDKKQPNNARYYEKSLGNPSVPSYSTYDDTIYIKFKNDNTKETYGLDRTSLELNMIGKFWNIPGSNPYRAKYNCELLSPDALKDKLQNTARKVSQILKDKYNKRKL